MHTKLNATLSCVAFAAILLAGNTAAADERDVTVAIRVSSNGLDLRRPADAQTFYGRLKNAAWVTCTRGNRVNLAPVENVIKCVDTALGGAVRSAKAPALTRIYLATHTPLEAAASGIQMAATDYDGVSSPRESMPTRSADAK